MASTSVHMLICLWVDTCAILNEQASNHAVQFSEDVHTLDIFPPNEVKFIAPVFQAKRPISLICSQNDRFRPILLIFSQNYRFRLFFLIFSQNGWFRWFLGKMAVFADF